MNQRQANRIVAAWAAGLLEWPEALESLDLPAADKRRLLISATGLCDELLRRSGRESLTACTLQGIVAEELSTSVRVV